MKARAKTLDGEIVEGYLSPDCDGKPCIDMFDEHNIFKSRLIYPQTIQYQIGDEWYSMEELEKVMAMWSACMRLSKEQGDD